MSRGSPGALFWARAFAAARPIALTGSVLAFQQSKFSLACFIFCQCYYSLAKYSYSNPLAPAHRGRIHSLPRGSLFPASFGHLLGPLGCFAAAPTRYLSLPGSRWSLAPALSVLSIANVFIPLPSAAGHPARISFSYVTITADPVASPFWRTGRCRSHYLPKRISL